MKTTKRQCNGACGCQTRHTATVDAEGRPVWECGCCGRATKRIIRRRQNDELDRLFEELAEKGN